LKQEKVVLAAQRWGGE